MPPAVARTVPNLLASENDIKGRVAEALVDQLFRALGWKVLKFGMEHTHPHVFESIRGRNDDVSRAVRSQPDFIVQKSGGQPFFVEVKYRAGGRLTLEDIGTDYPHLTTFFVLVSPYRIQCVSYAELKTGMYLDPEISGFYFADRKEFNADKKTVLAFVDLASKLFSFDRALPPLKAPS